MNNLITTHEANVKSFEEEALKYFAWVDSSGIHGKERSKAYLDFLLPKQTQSSLALLQAMKERIDYETPVRKTEYETHNTYNDGARDVLSQLSAYLEEAVIAIKK